MSESEEKVAVSDGSGEPEPETIKKTVSRGTARRGRSKKVSSERAKKDEVEPSTEEDLSSENNDISKTTNTKENDMNGDVEPKNSDEGAKSDPKTSNVNVETEKNGKKDIQDSIKEESKDNLKEDSKDNLKEDSKNNIKEDSKDNLKEDSKNNIKEDSKDNIKEDSKDNLKDDRKDNLKEDSKDNLKEVRKDNVKEDSKDDLKEDSQNNVKGETQNNVKEDSRENVKENSQENVKEDSSENKKKSAENDVPELDDTPTPPTINTTPSASKTLKLRTSFSTGDESEEKKNDESEKMEDDNQIPEEFTVVEEVESDSDDVQEVPLEKMDTDVVDTNKNSPQVQTLEGMTVIDEVIDETEKKDDDKHDNHLEPDTEMVSEDELPAEVSKEPETEAVSDEELPTSGDLPDTEAVSEDELPPEGSDKKKKKHKTTPTKDSSDADRKKRAGEVESTKKESAKRKLASGGYDPTSPTSEASDDTPAAKKAATETRSVSKPAKPKVLPELEKYWKAVKEDATDFTGWTYLLQYVDQENDVEAAREAYDAFLSHYPYCYGYWRKFADYEKRKGNKEKCEEVFERGLKAIPFSVDLWIHYLNYCKTTFADNEEFLRNTFEKALETCGLEFRSDRLWEANLKWETENKNLQNVTKIYDRLLATPTQGYLTHFDAFCEHINNSAPDKVLDVDEFLTLRQEVLAELKQSETPVTEPMGAPGDDGLEAPPGEEPAGQAVIVVASPEETAKLREKIIAVRKKIHQATKEAVAARLNYEEGIKRPYFHVKPLERCQLKNWKEYLEYEIGQGDSKRIHVLFERCLIACALYEEFWLRYLRYLEDKCTDKTDVIKDVYERACTIHHKKKPGLHLHWAIFEETQGNYEKASEILSGLEELLPNLIQVIYRRINLARRSGNLEEASRLYEYYIEKAKNKMMANNMTIKYARFSWKMLNDIDKAVNILKKALEKDKENPRLYLQLIDMAIQRTPIDEDEVVAAIDLYVSRDSAELEQRVMFAQRKIEFLEDFGSSVRRVQKATDEFQKLLKQLQEKKKKNDEAKMKSDESKKKTDSKEGSGPLHTGSQPSQPPSASTGPYSSAPPYNQGSGYSQPPPQNYNQGGYNQQPPYNQPPYNQQYNQNDPNYNNYQSWGYSQPGYGGYNQGWGGYNYY